MQLSEFLDFDAIKPSLSAGNKRALLQQLAQFAAARLGVDPGEVLSSISERERLGSTGFGHGVAIPHGKIAGLNRIYCLFARLAEPVDYKSIDGQRVEFDYRGIYRDVVNTVTPADVAWTCGLVERLSDAQLEDAFRAGGYTGEQSTRYVRKIREKVESARRLLSGG